VVDKKMLSHETIVAELFELAIKAELAVEQLYRSFETKFAHYPNVAQFWANYARDEAGHAQWLRDCRVTSRPEHLSALADSEILDAATWIQQFSLENVLAQVHTLQDAYELAHELEHSETNLVFEFLITNYSGDKSYSFLRAQLTGHVDKLTNEFPEGFRFPSVRRAVKALE